MNKQIVIANKRELAALRNSGTQIKSINGMEIDKIKGSWKASNTTVTVYPGGWEYVRYDIMSPKSYFFAYPVTVVI